MLNRTFHSIKNSSMALIAQILTVVISFTTRTFFIHSLGVNYLGVGGLFQNILTLLSLSELGIGTAITYSLYAPLAQKDEEKVSALINLYRKAYLRVAFVILFAGLSLVPFLELLIKEQSTIPDLKLIYVLYLVHSAFGYILGYKRSAIIANQQGYIDSINRIVFLLVQNIFQILILVYTSNFIYYLAVQILFTVGSDITLAIKAKRVFPYLNKYKGIAVDKADFAVIRKNVLASISNKIGSVVVTGTNNIMISMFVGVYWVGIYSNYVLIVNTVSNLVNQVVSAVTSSVGHYVSTEERDKSYSLFRRLLFISNIINLICSALLLALTDPFIKLWIGKDFILNQQLLILIVLQFYIIQMRQPVIIFINAYGLFWQIKWKSIVEACINLAASVWLFNILGPNVICVLLGTLISNALTNIWWEPYTAFKHGFNKPLRIYFKQYFTYTCSSAVILIINTYICAGIPVQGLAGLLIRAIVTGAVVVLLIYLGFNKTEEYAFLTSLLKRIGGIKYFCRQDVMQ